jgi:hypothetical protein
MTQLSDVDHAYVYRLEMGDKTNPSDEIMEKLLKVLKPSERDAGILKWLVSHADADVKLVDHVLDDPQIPLNHFTAAAGMVHRGSARPDPKTLIARVRRAFEDE